MMQAKHKPLKKFGQNFLVNPQIAQNIVNSANIKQHSNVLEIGPGEGALTDILISQTSNLTAIEKDRRLFEILKSKYQMLDPQPKLINKDALYIDYNQFSQLEDLIIIGNLPYNVGSNILLKILNSGLIFQRIIFMLQQELIDRICSGANSKKYGRIGIQVQINADVRKVLTVEKENFFPQPKVQSAVVELKPKTKPYETIQNKLVFDEILRQGFSLRRKKISNSLKNFLALDDFLALNIDRNLRAENLSIEDYINISNYCTSKNIVKI